MYWINLINKLYKNTITQLKRSSESLGRRETDEIKESMTFGANEIRDGVLI